MKKILVPTDFSMYAEFAATAAFIIAAKTGAAIHFFHKADLPSGWEDWPAEKRAANPTSTMMEQDMLQKLDKLISRGEKHGVQCYHSYCTGKLITCIKNVMVRENIDLIVMGSHGASGKEEYFIGSNAQKVIRKLHVPVLVIKSRVTELKFEKVMFATGLATSDLEAFGIFLDVIRPFEPTEVHIMAVDTSSYFTQPTIIMKEALKLFQNKASDYQTSTHFYRDYSVEAGIRHFSEEVGIDLIGISNRERHPFKRMLQGSNVEMLVNHSDVPVLSIDY